MIVSTANKALVLHTANPSCIPSTPNGALSPLGGIPEYRASSKPKASLGMAQNKMTTIKPNKILKGDGGEEQPLWLLIGEANGVGRHIAMSCPSPNHTF